MSTVDASQQKILMFMPVLMVVISFKMPTGVLLYWAISQIISSGQQILIMKNGKKLRWYLIFSNHQIKFIKQRVISNEMKGCKGIC